MTLSDVVFAIDFEQTADGRWLADVTDMYGVEVYAHSREEALVKCEALARRVIALHPLSREIQYRPLIRRTARRDWQGDYDVV
ncbi:MAG: hypothetical protein BroJett018_33430 [Chloroflexota bacterium]|nr:MAG: hypothetical protein BroJett018_33430 [Chloroflexota bacterium]